MKVKKLNEDFSSRFELDESLEDAQVKNQDEKIAEATAAQKLALEDVEEKTADETLDESIYEAAMKDYRKLAGLGEDEQLTENLDEWALNEAAVKNNVQRNDLRHKLIGEDITIDQAARALETEAEVAADKTVIEQELDQSLKRALWMQKRGLTGNFPNKLFISLPGAGKTSIIYQWAERNNVNIVYKDCKTMDMASLGGILTKPTNPDDPYSGRLATKEFHVLNEPRTVLFLDELNRASHQIQGSLLTLINDHTVWDPNQPRELRFLPNFLFTIAAINPPSGRDPGLKPLGSAMRNRFAAIETPGNPMETLKYLRGYYGKLIEVEDDPEMKVELEGKLAMAEVILTSPKFKYDTAIDEDEHEDDQAYQSLSPRSFTDALENSDGTKAGLLAVWNKYCNYEKKRVIDGILQNYVDVKDKANDVLRRDTDSTVFNSKKSNMDMLRARFAELG